MDVNFFLSAGLPQVVSRAESVSSDVVEVARVRPAPESMIRTQRISLWIS